MIAKYVQKGESIDYRPTEFINAGDVVIQDNLVGVARLDIQVNTLGSLAVVGVFDMPKSSGSVNVGSPVYWDNTNKNVTTTATDNVYLGKCVLDAQSDDGVIRVLLNAPYVEKVINDAQAGE